MPGLDLKHIRTFITDNVPDGLRGHCERTAQHARKLAEHHRVDADKVEAAALLHDFVKYYTREELDDAIAEIGFGALEFGALPEEIVHGPAAALLAEHRLDISDKDVLEAISLHTTADAEMGDVAKIVFLADFTEEGRDMPGAAEDRAACLGDLDQAVLHVLARKLSHVLEQRQPIDPRAWQAYNAFAARCATQKT